MRIRAKSLFFFAKTLLETLFLRAKTLLLRARTFFAKACRRQLLKDQISELPDEIIVCILSLLTMKEAGQTSVLSKRWRDVWSYIPVLNFDDSDTLLKLWIDEKLLEVEKPRYLSWVNQVVSSYKGRSVDEFRVRFDICETSRDSIDNWVKFAMEKRVKRFELNLKTHEESKEEDCYTFHNLSICNSLTSLKLASVNVTDEVFQNLLERCPCLEYLSVESSESLTNIKVTEDTISLKYLEILYCFDIKHVEISSLNLVSFKYHGPERSVSLKRTPRLANLFVDGTYGKCVSNNFLELSSHLIQLEALTLWINFRTEHVLKSVDQFPQCKELKQLEVMIRPGDEENLFCLAPLIKACPFLHKFVLKLGWWNPVPEKRQLTIEDCPHYHLKIVEIVGFHGNTIDLEFIMYLIKNSVALEKIIINTCRPSAMGSPWEFEVDETKILARKQAEKLREKLKHGVDLIIV